MGPGQGAERPRAAWAPTLSPVQGYAERKKTSLTASPQGFDTGTPQGHLEIWEDCLPGMLSQDKRQP